MVHPSKSTSLSSVIPQGPMTLSAQFYGSNQQYDYFIPPGENPKVGDIILTSVLWGTVPGAGRLKDNIMSGAARHSIAAPRALKRKSESQFLDDDDPDGEGEDGLTISFIDSPFSSISDVPAISVTASTAFCEKLRPAVVTALHSNTSGKAHRYYMLGIPLSDMHARKIQLDAVIMRTIEQLKARARLTEIVHEQAEMELFRKVAATNPEAQRLIMILEGKSPPNPGDTNRT